MKIHALVTAIVISAGFVAPSFAFDYSTSAMRPDRHIQKVVCDPNGEGKQANCVRECEEEEIRSRATYATANLANPKKADEERKAAKLACDKKCGC